MADEKTSITTQVDLKSLEDVLQGAARPALVIMTGKLLGKKYDLVKEENIIGRSSDCEIPIKEEDISRNHAKLVVVANRVKVSDMGSTNGTYVNRKKVDGEAVLENGDQLRCGNTVFKFLSEGSVDSVYHDELYKQATLDPLTRIFNRKHFNQEIESEVSRKTTGVSARATIVRNPVSGCSKTASQSTVPDGFFGHDLGSGRATGSVSGRESDTVRLSL